MTNFEVGDDQNWSQDPKKASKHYKKELNKTQGVLILSNLILKEWY